MKQIRSSMEYEGLNNSKLKDDLRAWHAEHPFVTGIDWPNQYMYATMTDMNCFAFILKHPEYAERFFNV